MGRARAGVRVIAGVAKGRRLETPPGLTTRPVSDRVKESLFGQIEPVLHGARVLDLYAGSGALAIEALSRGAASAMLVERDPAVLALVEANLATTGFTDRATVVRADVLVALARPPDGAFDLVFLDPPYETSNEDVERALALLMQGPSDPRPPAPGAGGRTWLAPGATVVVRRRRQSGPPVLPSGLEFTRIRNYGDTLLLVVAAT